MDKDIAKALGISSQAFSMQKKRGTIKVDQMAKICNKYKVSIQWLLTGSEPNDNRKLIQENDQLERYIARLERIIEHQDKQIERLESELGFTEEDDEPLVKRNKTN